MTTKKKKNPQDATLRNIRALKTRVKALEEFIYNQGSTNVKVDERLMELTKAVLRLGQEIALGTSE